MKPRSSGSPLTDIQIRDPFVLPVPEERAYYLFGSTDPNIWEGPGIGFDCYRSFDLAEWSGPLAAFRPPPGFWSPGCYWAPEVHRHDGSWFMVATFTGPDGHRGTQVLRAARPEGPYAPWSDGPVTPGDWQCLDGTLHVDENGPWLVFCHEWAQCADGEVSAVRLAPDLRTALGEVTQLFRGSYAAWSVPFADAGATDADGPCFVTDGPFLHRCASGELLMLWSSFAHAATRWVSPDRSRAPCSDRGTRTPNRSGSRMVVTACSSAPSTASCT